MRRIYHNFILCFLISGCVTATDRLEQKEKVGGPFSKVFFAQYSEVEEALRMVIAHYPQLIDNSDAGIFETDFIKSDSAYRAPHKMDSKIYGGFRYRLRLQIIKGQSERQGAVKVIITKMIENSRDFFSESEKLVSDSYEEEALLYRIGREIQIKQAIKRLSKKVKS